MAREGSRPVIGRAQEIETTIEVLARRKKNSPVLIGEPGVGRDRHRRRAGAADGRRRSAETLRDKRLVELNINAMVAAPSIAASSRSACRRCSRK